MSLETAKCTRVGVLLVGVASDRPAHIENGERCALYPALCVEMGAPVEPAKKVLRAAGRVWCKNPLSGCEWRVCPVLPPPSYACAREHKCVVRLAQLER